MILLTWPTLPAAQGEPLTQAEYVAAVSLGTEYWYPLYSECGARGRYSRILTKCGYKKEADELDSATEALVRKRLDQLAQGRIDAGKCRQLEAAMVARETAHGVWTGYKLGFGEGFSITSQGLTAGAYEGVCKSALTRAREWLSEGTK